MSNFINDSLAEQIERGEVFVTSINPNILIGSDAEYIINTSTDPASLFISAESDDRLSVYLYEDATTSSDGGALNPVNMNFASANTLGATLFFSPTLLTNGTSKIFYQTLPRNRKKQTPLDREVGVVLKPSTKYLLKFVSQSDSVMTLYTTIFMREL